MNKETILTLDDGNKYVIVQNFIYENKKYLFLIDINNNSNYMFCELNDNKLKKIQDNNLINNLLLKINNIDESKVHIELYPKMNS